MKRFHLFAIVMLLAIAPASPARPADSPPRVVVTQTDESKFPEISVYFELPRPDGSFKLDAPAKSFRITEEDRDRPITGFDAPVTVRAQPMTLVLVLDHSGSMAQDGRIGALKRAVASFMDGLPGSSRVAVVAFGSEVRLICPFTTDRGQVVEAVDALHARGATRYYDAVAGAIDLLGDETGRRAILAMTDGVDTESRDADLDSVIARARKASLPVHTLGFGGEIDAAAQALRRIAAETRGQSYAAADADQLRQIYLDIARRIGSTYRATFSTDRRVADGTLRPIRVFYAEAVEAGESAVFIRGMVVPAPGWPGLFLLLLATLIALGVAPGWLRRRRSASGTRGPSPSAAGP